jgi:hypothetical protein
MIAAISERWHVEPILTTTKRHGLLYEFFFCGPKTTTDIGTAYQLFFAIGTPDSGLWWAIKRQYFDHSNLDKFGFRDIRGFSVLGEPTL